MKTLILLTMLMAVACIPLQACDKQDAKLQVGEIAVTPEGRVFLLTHSKRNLEKVILFAKNPAKYFSDIKNISDWCLYFSTYADHLLRHKKSKIWLISTWPEESFRTVDENKVDILTFMLLTSSECGHFAEELADRYTTLFESSYDYFVKDLEKRDKWKQVINLLQAGNWSAFKAGVEKLGDSPFVNELKKYVASLEK